MSQRFVDTGNERELNIVAAEMGRDTKHNGSSSKWQVWQAVFQQPCQRQTRDGELAAGAVENTGGNA